MLVFYVRHGEPIYDPDQLTPLGEQQAKSVASRIAQFGVDEIYASSSTRAIQTATPCSELLKKDVQILDFLNENHLNEKLAVSTPENPTPKWMWAHPDTAPLLARRDVREMGDEWYRHPLFEQYHFEQTILPFNRQLDAFFAAHGYEHDTDRGLYRVTNRQPEKRIAIFAHEMVGKLFMSHLLDIPFPYYAAHFEMKHTGLTVIRFDDGAFVENAKQPLPYARARVLTLSNDAHLFKDGLPLAHISSRIRDKF